MGVIYNIHGDEVYTENGQGHNCKLIAHRGWHTTAAQNTIASFVAAAENGFDWLEIDIRKCADGVYVLAHDATVTLYDNGTAVSVTIGRANYADIKDYTWDSQGAYKINTLLAAFNAMKVYGVGMVLDRKSGDNAELMGLAALAGVTDSVMLSYASPGVAMSASDLLSKYDSTPIRVIPTSYADMVSLMSAVSNPIYCDVNASNGTHKQQYLPIALASGLPILFSGCTTSNANVWQVLAGGCMANEDKNISAVEFETLLTADYNITCSVSASDTADIAVGTATTLVATSDLATPPGYVYGYSLDNSIVTIKQTAFGQSATFEITGIAEGTATVRLFTGCGAVHDVICTVIA